MMRPEELTLLANQWRNMAGAGQAQVDYMRSAGMSGGVIVVAECAVHHANSVAEQLEERARELEKMRQDVRTGMRDRFGGGS